ncbi:hypothetical protein N7510_000737 [Penicillium lagena]|uniref:uncharacterized protein n=1 Tax=Penicillium lagena TaxID=94218 RepID=UPI002540AFD8|nr:uncharacterized protein N7510_000737 [Penicillium lagena]KAJ5624428.1 hypothetical protein N7510_000737 [Penicillium lagena]
MPDNGTQRKLLPAKFECLMQSFEVNPSTIKRHNVSLACTECRKRKLKCSGTISRMRCTSEACQCTYDPKSDRRRKAHGVELLGFDVGLCRIAAKLRSGTPEEISWFIWNVQKVVNGSRGSNYYASILDK